MSASRSVSPKKSSGPYYAVCLNVKGRCCTVVGGGVVALRKVRTLLDHGAAVHVISPQSCSELDKLARAGVIGCSTKEYTPSDLTGSWLVIAATDDAALNSAIGKDARRRRMVVNVADDAVLSDFITPSCLTKGGLTVAVSTGGASPALARRIRLMLEGIIGDEYGALVELVAEVRNSLRRKGLRPDGATWEKALDINVLVAMLREGKIKQARSLIIEKLTSPRSD